MQTREPFEGVFLAETTRRRPHSRNLKWGGKKRREKEEKGPPAEFIAPSRAVTESRKIRTSVSARNNIHPRLSDVKYTVDYCRRRKKSRERERERDRWKKRNNETETKRTIKRRGSERTRRERWRRLAGARWKRIQRVAREPGQVPPILGNVFRQLVRCPQQFSNI